MRESCQAIAKFAIAGGDYRTCGGRILRRRFVGVPWRSGRNQFNHQSTINHQLGRKAMRLMRIGGSVTGRSWAWCIGKAAWLALGVLILGLGQVLQAQVTVFSEGFEGAFPEDNGWTVGDANAASGA